MRDLEARGAAVDEPEPLEGEDPRSWLETELARGETIGRAEMVAEESRGHVFADGAQVPCEGAEVENVVVNRGQRHERAEPVPSHDETLAFQHFEGLAEGHEGDTEILREPPLIVESGAGRDVAGAYTIAQGLSDLMIAGHPSLHASGSPIWCSRTLVAAQRRCRARRRNSSRNNRQLRRPPAL